MTDITLISAVDDEIIPAAHNNALVQALLLDLIPRNASRVAESDAGQLGNSAYRWLRSYIKEMLVGTSANNLKIYEPVANTLRIERNGPTDEYIDIEPDAVKLYVNGVLKFTVNDSGIDWSTQSDNTIPLGKINGFVPFSHSSTLHIFNDSNNVLLATTAGPSLVYVEPVSNLDFAGGGFRIDALNVFNAPTSAQKNVVLFRLDGVSDPIETNPIVVPAGKEIRVYGGAYTARINLHIIRLT